MSGLLQEPKVAHRPASVGEETLKEEALGGTPSRSPSSTGTLVQRGNVPAKEGEKLEKEDLESAQAEGPVRTIFGIKWIVIILSLLSVTFLFALDSTIVATIQPQIVERFGEAEKLPWLGVTFSLGAAAFTFPWTKLYGQFSAKWLFIIAVTLFEIGSVICGASPTMNAMIIGRVIAGVGGSGMYLGAMTLLSILTSIHERSTYIGLTGLTFGVGSVLGPIIGGAFADSKASWRWSFYINLIFFAVFLPVYVFLIPDYGSRPDTRKFLKNLDFLGITIQTGMYVAGVMAMSFGGVIYAWNSGSEIALWVVFGVLLIALIFQTIYAIGTTKEHRIFPGELVVNWEVTIFYVLTASAAAGFFVPTYYIPLYFQFVKQDSALDAAVRLLPFIVFLVFFCLLNGIAMSKYGYYWFWYVFGGATMLIGGALMYTIDEHSSVASVYGYSILIAAGGGSCVQAGFSITQVKVKPEQIPSVIGYLSSAQTGAVVISLAIAGAVYLNGVLEGLRGLFPDVSDAVLEQAISGTRSELLRNAPQAIQTAALEVIIDTMSKIYILVMVAGALILVLSAFLKREKLFIEIAAPA